MQQQRTVVEQSFERAVRERLRDVEEYTRGGPEQRERLEREIRENVRIRREEDQV